MQFADAVRKVEAVLTAHGYASACARILAENCLTAQRDGSISHGVFRLKDYLSTIESGYVNGDPTPRVADVAPGFVRVDADNGFAQVALARARPLLIEKAAENGIAIVAIRNSHHLGALYLDAEGFADEGFLALAVVNSDAFVAPPGATRAVYGTNPLAFAAPRSSGPPLVFDQASATVAHGDLQVAARQGRRLPSGTGIDAQGRPTGDPGAILDGGALSTFGGHKGASVALMVEIMCAGLVGADFSFDVPHGRPAGAGTARTGETVVVIDPGAGAEALPELPGRVDVLAAALADAGQLRIPGERRARARNESGARIRMDEQQWADIERLHAAALRASQALDPHTHKELGPA
ncbi:Ldh family oxidoreductase [Streptomyces sp. NPDC002680]|uniref:Ldh family oxidoreductase n=1 Tax=Streptomyces sp. NPDC002680 TaxID=3364659 RepID=UPI003685B72D